MKIVAVTARMLLGAIFVFFGANILYQFMPAPPLPPGAFSSFATALAATHYFHVIGFLQVVGGLLLLFNRFVPLGLTILAPILVNILMVHFLMAPSGIPMALLVTGLWLLTFYHARSAFSGLFKAKLQS
jgi:putative oxidoreductase